MQNLPNVIDTFFEHYHKSFESLATPHDPQWPSPCEIGDPWTDDQGDAWIKWQPVPRHSTADDFAGLESALEIAIHPDIKAHYGRYWSAHLEAEAPDGHVSLLYLWNQQDADRLVENLIGHAVACRHNRTPFSVFFACTEPDSDLFLTVNNDTGAVQLEAPGKKPLRTVSASLSEFMQRLVPAAGPSADASHGIERLTTS
jgi:SecY interacting protein Syd